MSAVTTPWSQLRVRDIAWGTLCIIGVVMAFGLVVALRNVLMLVFLGLIVATAIRPLMQIGMRMKFPRPLAASLAMLVFLSLLTASVLLVVPTVATQVEAVWASLPQYYDSIRAYLLATPSRLIQQFAQQLPAHWNPAAAAEQPNPEQVVQQSVSWFPVVAAGLFDTLTTLVFAFYWLLYRDRTLQSLRLLVPEDRREANGRVWADIESQIGGFVRGQLLLALITGVMSLIGYWLVGAPYVVLLGVLAGIFELIPFVGSLLMAIVATALGFSVSPQVGLAALAVGTIIQQLENNLLAPRIMDEAVGVSPMVSLLSFVGFAATFGPLGGMLAIPLAAVLQVLVRHWAEYRAQAAPGQSIQGRATIDVLRYQLRDLADDLISYMRGKETAHPEDDTHQEDELEQIISDLSTYLDTNEQKP